MSGFNDCCSALLLCLLFREKTNNAAGHASDIELSNAGPIFRQNRKKGPLRRYITSCSDV